MFGRRESLRLGTDVGAEQKKCLFVASTGGHLAQLVRISQRLAASQDSLWITFDSEQSRSLLRGKRVAHFPYVAPRDYAGVLRSARMARRILRSEEFDLAVSTGAALALGVLPVTALRGIPSTYIESVSRFDGPSMTGRLLAATRLIEMRTQHASWATRTWRPFPSVLTGFASVPRVPPKATTEPLRAFVTLGTIKPYRFDSLVDALLATNALSDETVWQVGETSRNDLPGQVRHQVSNEEFIDHSMSADIVITHAGVGSILNLMDHGISPLVVPRRATRNEHVDDHQVQICAQLQRLQLGTVAEVSDISSGLLHKAASLSVISKPEL